MYRSPPPINRRECHQRTARSIGRGLRYIGPYRRFKTILCLNGGNLLLEVLKELVEGYFYRAFKNNFRRGGNFAFHFGVRVIIENGGGGILNQVYHAGRLDGTHRAGWLGYQYDPRGGNDFAGLQKYDIWP